MPRVEITKPQQTQSGLARMQAIGARVNQASSLASPGGSGMTIAAAKSNPNSPANQLVGLGESINSFSQSTGGSSSSLENQAPNTATEQGAAIQASPPSQSPQANNAYSRRMNALQQDPNAAIDQGLIALKDPSVPQYVRDAYAEPLLRAKYKINRGGSVA